MTSKEKIYKISESQLRAIVSETISSKKLDLLKDELLSSLKNFQKEMPEEAISRSPKSYEKVKNR